MIASKGSSYYVRPTIPDHASWAYTCERNKTFGTKVPEVFLYYRRIQ